MRSITPLQLGQWRWRPGWRLSSRGTGECRKLHTLRAWHGSGSIRIWIWRTWE